MLRPFLTFFAYVVDLPNLTYWSHTVYDDLRPLCHFLQAFFVIHIDHNQLGLGKLQTGVDSCRLQGVLQLLLVAASKGICQVGVLLDDSANLRSARVRQVWVTLIFFQYINQHNHLPKCNVNEARFD